MKPKIAVVHDWLTGFAGAEMVTADILAIWPHCDLYSVVDFLSDEDRVRIGGKRTKTTFVQHLPWARRWYRAYMPIMPIAIEQLDLSNYDIVISSSHAVAKGVLVGPDQLHVCYCHSPMRYIWDLQHQYLRNANLGRSIKGLIVRWLFHFMRNWDHRTSNGVDFFIANSDYIGRRILKVYRRESRTIYPGIALERYGPGKERADFYLTASRLVPYKNIITIVRAFARMPARRLVVIGDGPEIKNIRKEASANVSILGYQPFEVLLQHMQSARAFVFSAEEDFGIAPVEAQACGTPVIAFAKGGALETIIDGVTGVFFYEQSVSAIMAAVESFEQTFVTDPTVITENACRFSTARFQSELQKFVEDRYRSFTGARVPRMSSTVRVQTQDRIPGGVDRIVSATSIYSDPKD